MLIPVVQLTSVQFVTLAAAVVDVTPVTHPITTELCSMPPVEENPALVPAVAAALPLILQFA
jgi:hypothetical protein